MIIVVECDAARNNPSNNNRKKTAEERRGGGGGISIYTRVMDSVKWKAYRDRLSL